LLENGAESAGVAPFDRDYVGGGPAMKVSGPGGGSGILLVYHAEYHWCNSCSSPPLFFGSLGLAFSTDNGQTFEKLGQIVQPHPGRQEWVQDNGSRSLSIGDGPFVLGDAGAHAVDPRSAAAGDSYIYVFYIDQDNDSSCGSRECLAVARALESDVIDAAFAHKLDAVSGLFKKYYNGKFEEPAATGHPDNIPESGHFTPILDGGFSPSALYDASMGAVILGSGDGNDLALRTSSNLVSWPQTPGTTVSGGSAELTYPSLIGDIDGNVGGANPLLFYSYTDPASGGWSKTTFTARKLSVP
jgi:hypothetical protein